jgi:hypothetical protein
MEYTIYGCYKNTSKFGSSYQHLQLPTQVTTTSITSLESLLLLNILTFIFLKLCDNSLILYNRFFIVNTCLCVTVLYIYM